MWKQLEMFWQDERGYVPVVEWALVASILTLGAFATLLAMHTP